MEETSVSASPVDELQPPVDAGGMQATILRCAAELFAERGFEGVSTRNIADRVGIKQATLYHHFRDKKAIHEAVVAAAVAFVSERLMEALSGNASPEQKLKDLFVADLALFHDGRPEARITDREFIEKGDARMTFLAGALQRPYAALAEVIRQIAPDANAGQSSLFVFSLAYGARKHRSVQLLLASLPELESPEALAQALTEWTLRSLRGASAPSSHRERELAAENERLRRALVELVLQQQR